MATEVIPFGKYKGQPVEAMAADQQYVDWLMGQSWFRDKYQNIYTLIVNNFTEPSETPEHNALQASFLDESNCLSVLRVSGIGEKIIDGINDRLRNVIKDCVRERGEYCERLAREEAHYMEAMGQAEINGFGDDWWKITQCRMRVDNYRQDVMGAEARMREAEAGIAGDKIFCMKAVGFEVSGWDVVIEIKTGFSHDTMVIEVKPGLGDDYPAVLRQMKARSGHNAHFSGNVFAVLVIGEFCASGASLDVVRKIFELSDFYLVVLGK